MFAGLHKAPIGAHLLALTLFIAFSGALAIGARAATSTAWSQLGFDSGHSGFNPHEHRIGLDNVRSLQQLWSFSLGSGNWVGNIVEADDIVYVPSSSGVLYALNTTNGQQVWSYASGTPYGYNTSTEGVVVDSGLVFTICTLPGGAQGTCALQAQTGHLQWSYVSAGSTSSAGSAPVVADGMVYFEECSSAGCDYVALNELTGIDVWTVPEPCPGSFGITPSVYKGILYVGEGCNQQGSNVVALRDSDGSLVWTREVTGVPHGLTVADGIIAYVRFDGTTDYIGALSASHGKPIWGPTAVNNVGFWSMPAIAYQQIYAWIFINDYGYVADYTKRLGALNWQYTVARSFPSVANHVLYFAFNGSPLALNAATGQYLWNIGGTDNFGLPIIVDGVLYGGCSGTNVCAYGLPNDRSHVHIGEVPAKAHSP